MGSCEDELVGNEGARANVLEVELNRGEPWPLVRLNVRAADDLVLELGAAELFKLNATNSFKWSSRKKGEQRKDFKPRLRTRPRLACRARTSTSTKVFVFIFDCDLKSPEGACGPI